MTVPAVTLSKLARAAMAYAAKGFVLVPLHTATPTRCSCGNATCPSPGKHPRTSHGLLEATSDPAIVSAWWQRWPDANIGCKPGASGYVVLDVDGPEGAASAQAAGLLAEPTLVVKTGRGEHRWYRHPGGHIPNGTLGAKVDIRGDAGYVLLPPSLHYSGAVYQWLGKLEDIAELPPAIVSRIQGAAPGTAVANAPRPDALPAWMIPWLEVRPGERNQTMTRFVGWAFTKHTDEATVLAMALGVSAAWPTPMDRREVEAVVRSIGTREARKPQRQTSTGTTLTVASEPEPEASPSLKALADRQIESAMALGRIDFSGAPRWGWVDLDAMMGPMLPGDLVVVGGLTGNGKTALTMSQVAHWMANGTTVLYVPLEIDPERVRRQWAAWACGLDWIHVARNDWHRLPAGAQAEHDAALVTQWANPHIHLPPDRRVSLPALAKWTAQAVAEVGAKVVIIDHFHRMDVGGASQNYRVQVTEVARHLKDLGREHGIPILALAQLNQDPNPLDRYYPPHLKRLKESAGLGEEADVVLMLSRRLKHDLEADTIQSIRSGHADVRDFEDPSVMMVTNRKSRLDDAARDRSIRLWVESGKVVNMAKEWQAVRDPRWEP